MSKILQRVNHIDVQNNAKTYFSFQILLNDNKIYKTLDKSVSKRNNHRYRYSKNHKFTFHVHSTRKAYNVYWYYFEAS